ncbi:cysteine protease atg4b-like protein [Nannochloropsis gaditana]|uniref:Cysteine protease n=1 Tax=Nannochloropsis gaditana TaxID=72520 RepID=W7TVV9_9STRA|nr:cysteine protease atg4b-like protein [Nannochloropsis gaditana]
MPTSLPSRPQYVPVSTCPLSTSSAHTVRPKEIVFELFLPLAPLSAARRASASSSSSPSSSVTGRWILGKRYDPEDLDGWTQHFRSIPWFTYRHTFPTMAPYPYTDDAGWGCMLRSAQMMMGEGLLRCERGWRGVHVET